MTMALFSNLLTYEFHLIKIFNLLINLRKINRDLK